MGIASLERIGMRVLIGLLLSVFVVTASRGNGATDRPTVIIAVGAAGESEYAKEFSDWAARWTNASETAQVKAITIGITSTNAEADLQSLQRTLANEPTNSLAELWLVFIGHGTFDGREAKFNLRGPDLSATDLAEWLKPFRRPIIVLNCASSSSPFLNKLSAPNRVIVTATRSGYEDNFARFGKFLAATIAARDADLDKDGQTSVLEAFLMASRQTAEFYAAEGRLATEHALLDDNGDGLGTPADFFRGIRAIKKPSGGSEVDGLRAHQIHLVRSASEQQMPPELRVRRDDLEMAIARLRELKEQMPEAEYYQRLEPLLLELAKLYATPPSP